MVFFTIQVPSEYHPGTVRVPSEYHPGTIRVHNVLLRKDTMFCFAKTQCSVSQRHIVLFHKDTMFCSAKTQCSVSQRHKFLFRKDAMFSFAKTQCSVCRKHNVLFTIDSVAYHPGIIRVPSGHPDGRRIVFRFASKLRSKGPVEFVSKIGMNHPNGRLYHPNDWSQWDEHWDDHPKGRMLVAPF